MASDEPRVASADRPGRLRTTVGRVRAMGHQTFDAMSVRDYRILWWGFMGTWMAMQWQQVARGWVAYQLTGNALALGWVTLAMGLPRIVLSPIGGVLADRFTKRSVLLWTQSSLGLFALCQAVLLATHLMTIQWLVVFGFFQGTAFSFVMPARQAYLPEIVGRHRLANAIALNSAGMNLTRVAGPAIAGIFIALPFIGATGTFFLISVCYVWVWLSVYRIKTPGVAIRRPGGSGQSMRDGFGYVFRSPSLLALMSLGFVPLAIGMPYINLMPVIAVHDLHIGSVGLGALLSIGGVGSLFGTLTVAYLSKYQGKAKMQLVSGIVFGIALVGFGFFASRDMLPLALPFLFVAGTAGDMYMAINSSLIMLATEPGVYGRVMGVYMMAQSIRPISVFPIAALADAIGTSVTVAWAGSLVAAFVGGVATLYPGYRKIGTESAALSEVAAAGGSGA